jgi:hypothetical protein
VLNEESLYELTLWLFKIGRVMEDAPQKGKGISWPTGSNEHQCGRIGDPGAARLKGYRLEGSFNDRYGRGSGALLRDLKKLREQRL